ncbi:hypothetical protein DAPPUDRAFT_251609 [Daphnia pulex]|uniref:RNase III domain-containing protein n=1 Tax=Daphnia pulex TaxID=6669 RepID=E9H0R4_DAPPU|nr:hypothetical protein DAPPUDRAFT_251609 [Daphnia pulex]|eukprot:EFX74690.1 hypothetical protein DAPPUDRAFT_251609 [Daphnia pulex]
MTIVDDCSGYKIFAVGGWSTGIPDTVVLDLLLDLNPRYNQGQLSVLKSAITCNDTLAVIAVRTGLHLLLQHRLPAKQIEELESFVDHQNKNQHLFSLEKELVIISSSEGDRVFDIDYPKVYADAFETLIGALLRDCEREDKVIRKVVLNLMGDVIVKFHNNIPVCPLQRVNQNRIKPEFKEEKNLPDGTFHVILKVKNLQSFHGSGPSMKSAKTAAAKLAITTMPWCPTQNQAQGRKHKLTKNTVDCEVEKTNIFFAPIHQVPENISQCDGESVPRYEWKKN